MSGQIDMLAARITNVFRPPRENPELVQAKLAAFKRQIPMMYALVILNTMTLASTFHGSAPRLLTLDLPAAFSIVCLFRIITWWRACS